jgi:hypothetical protein
MWTTTISKDRTSHITWGSSIPPGDKVPNLSAQIMHAQEVCCAFFNHRLNRRKVAPDGLQTRPIHAQDGHRWNRVFNPEKRRETP